MSVTLFDNLITELDEFLAPVADAVEDPFWLDRLLVQLGTTSEVAGGDQLVAALKAVIELKRQLTDLAAKASPSFSGISQLLQASDRALTAVRAFSKVGGPAEALAGLGDDLVRFLIAMHLGARHPLLFQLGVLLTIIEPAGEAALTTPIIAGDQILREPVAIPRFHPERLVSLLRDPVAVLQAEYVNSLATVGDGDAMADKLFGRLAGLLTELGVLWVYGVSEEERPFLGDAAPLVDHALTIYVEALAAGATADAGFTLSFSSADRGDLGLVASPFGALTISRQFGKWTLELGFTAKVDALAYGRHGVTLLASPSTTEVAGSISATLAAPEDGPAFILGTPTGSRLEVGGALLKAETSLSEARQSLALSADVSSSAIVIAPGDGDGFLSSILPAEGLQAKFDLGLAWSNERGFTFRGAGSLDATLPVGLSLRGVLTVPTIHLSLLAGDTGLTAEISASVGVSIGPVRAVVDRVGIATTITFPEDGGNLGIADLDLHFKSPNGVGIAIDAPGVIGGGYLNFDPQKQEYSGMLELQVLEKIAVKAIGLLTTRMPDGAKGYSLVAIITSEGFTPIQLGLGFKLTGIGGLVAVNRTFDEEALRAGLKNHTLDSVMFPKDPIRNAPQILSNLNKVFPPANGHHLFGPMAQIVWGSPPLITANLAVVLELGARLRLLILAQITAILPKRENDLVRLQMDAVGVIDFDQGTAALDATLYDSRLLKKFAMTGDMAMRLKWEGSPNFALAIGGLHPAFNPPPNFPKLERIAISLASGDNPRIRCEAYFALTANTVQFGARAELFASASGFSIQGEFGFDVLIQFDPFYFAADFRAQVQLKRGSTNLFKVRVEGTLAGPRPLHIKAKATFEILWWDVSIRVDRTLVKGEKPPLPEPIEVLPRLKEALGNPASWTGRPPDGQRALVGLRANPGAATDVLLHPLGTLTIKQGVVPLNLDISRFGQAAPAGARRFEITSISLGGQNQTAQPVKDFFAPAQFFEMSDEEKLSRPSFEPMAAGVSIGSEKFVFTANAADWLEVPQVEFETIIVDKQRKEPRRSTPNDLYRLSPDLLGKQSLFGAAGSSDIRRSGKSRYRTTIGKHRIANEGWSIVATADLAVQPVPGVAANKPSTYSEAAQALQKMKNENPAKAAGMKILRPSELLEPSTVAKDLVR